MDRRHKISPSEQNMSKSASKKIIQRNLKYFLFFFFNRILRKKRQFRVINFRIDRFAENVLKMPVVDDEMSTNYWLFASAYSTYFWKGILLL